MVIGTLVSHGTIIARKSVNHSNNKPNVRTCPLTAVWNRGRTGDIAIDTRDSIIVTTDKGTARVDNCFLDGERNFISVDIDRIYRDLPICLFPVC